MVKRSKTEFNTEVNTQFPDNNNNEITASRVRGVLGPDLTDSTAFIGDATTNDIPIVDSTGTLMQGALTETTNMVVSAKSLQTPGNSILISPNTIMSSANNGLSVHAVAADQTFLLTAQQLTDTGTEPILDYNAGAKEIFLVQDNFSEEGTGTSYTVDRTVATDSIVHGVVLYPTNSGTATITISDGNSGVEIFTFTTAVTGGQQNIIELVGTEGEPTPVIFPTGQMLRINSEGVQLNGDTISSVFVPYYGVERCVYDNLFVLNEDSLVAGEGITLTKNANNTITITADDEAFDAPRITNLAIDIASRVDLNTNLNTSHTITFDVIHQSSIQGNLTLEVVTGDNITVSTPFVNGANSKAVTLTGISTVSEGTVTFKLTGTDTQSNAFESNTVTINVRDLAAHEYFYHGLSDSNNPASIDLGTLSQEEVTGSGQIFTISSGTATSGQYLIFLVPADHTISSIVNTGTNINEFTSFTRTDDVRQINSVNYDSYVLGSLVAGFNANYRVTLA